MYTTTTPTAHTHNHPALLFLFSPSATKLAERIYTVADEPLRQRRERDRPPCTPAASTRTINSLVSGNDGASCGLEMPVSLKQTICVFPVAVQMSLLVIGPYARHG